MIRFSSFSAALLLCAVGVVANADKDGQTAPSASMGPTTGTNSSQTTPSLLQGGKDAFTALDTDDDGMISKDEARRDAALFKTFDKVDEDRNDQMDPAEFARSTSGAAPTQATKPK